jgi:hypothetical protein
MGTPAAVSMRLLSTAILWLIPLGAASSQVIVANSKVKSAGIGRGDLYDIFTGASNTFPDGSPAVAVLLKSGPAQDAFLKTYIGKGDTFLRGAWMRLVFAGKCSMPKTFDSDAELLHYVAATPGAIGYVASPPDDPHVITLTVK